MRLFSPPPLGALAWSALLCHWRPLSTPDYVCFCCDRRDITNCHHKLNATSRLCRHSQPTSQAGRRTHGRGQSETKSATSASLSPPLVCVMALASTWISSACYVNGSTNTLAQPAKSVANNTTPASASELAKAWESSDETEAVANPTGRPPQAIFSLSSGAFKWNWISNAEKATETRRSRWATVAGVASSCRCQPRGHPRVAAAATAAKAAAPWWIPPDGCVTLKAK